jgi:hypothetical protein
LVKPDRSIIDGVGQHGAYARVFGNHQASPNGVLQQT